MTIYLTLFDNGSTYSDHRVCITGKAHLTRESAEAFILRGGYVSNGDGRYFREEIEVKKTEYYESLREGFDEQAALFWSEQYDQINIDSFMYIKEVDVMGE